MSKIYLLVLLFIPFFSYSQKEKLFYFIENDSLIGVKNQIGKIIIPAKKTMFPNNYEDLTKSEIKDNILLFWYWNEGEQAYNRKGDFLFVPFIFDAGFDDFREGCIRFKEKNKVGLANEFGEKVIMAKYDYVSSCNFGIIKYCNDCHWDSTIDEEHPSLVGGTWGYLDKNGNEITATNNRINPKDIEIENHKFIPYQFKYNEDEERILKYFYTRKNAISKILNANCIELLNSS